MKTNCPNCGAPLDKDAICAYCGTVIRKKVKSGLVQTATEIRIICEEVDDDE